MSDPSLDSRVLGARRDLQEALDPAPPDLPGLLRRAHRRRWVRSTTLVAAVVAVAGVVLVVKDSDGEPATIVAGPGPGSANADLLAPGTWRTIAPSSLAGRSTMAAVWTGSEMLLWGGDGPDGPFDDGAAYDPRSDTWRRLPPSPLSARNAPAAVWTGSEMLLWGGAGGAGGPGGDDTGADGAAFDPSAGTWRSIAPAPITSAGRPSAVWTGSDMVVLAGFNSDKAAAYDPATDQWRSLPDLPANLQAPNPVSTWTGSRLVTVIQDPIGDINAHRIVSLALGDDTWTGAPPLGDGHGQVVVASSDDMLVAAAGQQAATLDPDGRSWTPLSPAPEGAGVGDTPGLWTGTELLFWDNDTVSVVDPSRRTWETTPVGDFTDRSQPAAVWADGVLVIWGGFPDIASGIMVRPRSGQEPGADPASDPMLEIRTDGSR